MRQYQVFKVANHESPVIVKVELDVKTGSDRFRLSFDSRGKQEITRLSVEMHNRGLESIAVLNQESLRWNLALPRRRIYAFRQRRIEQIL